MFGCFDTAVGSREVLEVWNYGRVWARRHRREKGRGTNWTALGRGSVR
jgi:hypothetical protein